PLHAAASTTARAVPPARWLILDIESLPDAPVFDANVGIREGCAEATGEASGGEGSGEQSSSPVTAAPQAAKARNSNWLDGQWKRREASLGEPSSVWRIDHRDGRGRSRRPSASSIGRRLTLR